MVRLKAILKEHDANFCVCGHEIGWGDIAWNEAQSEAGTPCSYIIIQCEACQTEIAWVNSWTWFDEDEDTKQDTVLHILEKDWKKRK